MRRLKDAFITALIAGLLALPLAAPRTVDGLNGLAVEWHVVDVGVACALIFLGRLALGLIEDGFGSYIAPLALIAGIASAYLPMPSHFLKTVAVAGSFVIALRAIFGLTIKRRHPGESRDPEGIAASASRLKLLWSIRLHNKHADRADGESAWIPAFAGMTLPLKRFTKNYSAISWLLLLFALILPFLPFTSRYALDVAVMVLTYVMLGWGLNITVGFAGLLDLGYVAFYALGAYAYALLAQSAGITFWEALPISGAIAALAGFLLGFPVLRLRGDYFAIVTLGFGEIVRLVLTNWTNLTNGPNGISGVPRPALFGLRFDRMGPHTFYQFFGLNFDPMRQATFLYYVILALALVVGVVAARLRRLPLGRAWEAFREDEIATAALGVNRTRIKLAAYSLGAMVAGMAGAFFAARMGFVSPESFTFAESAVILSIVILGGVGHPLGIAMAAALLIGMPELFREFAQYRMLAFGAGMVLVMIWRPGGLMAVREPTVKIQGLGAGS